MLQHGSRTTPRQKKWRKPAPIGGKIFKKAFRTNAQGVGIFLCESNSFVSSKNLQSFMTLPNEAVTEPRKLDEQIAEAVLGENPPAIRTSMRK